MKSSISLLSVIAFAGVAQAQKNVMPAPIIANTNVQGGNANNDVVVDVGPISTDGLSGLKDGGGPGALALAVPSKAESVPISGNTEPNQGTLSTESTAAGGAAALGSGTRGELPRPVVTKIYTGI